MSKSEQLVNRFSTYICIQEEYCGGSIAYLSDRELKTLMENLVRICPVKGEEEWVRFFLKSLIKAEKTLQFFLPNLNFSAIYTLLVFWNFSNRLVFCYLQLICYYAAKQISNSFKNSSNLRIHYSLKECFSIAIEIALKPAKLIKKFKFDSPIPVYGYAKQALKRGIQTQIASELKSRAIISTNEGLLHNISPTQLKQALLSYGIVRQNIIKYRLAWQCFNDLFETVRSLKKSQDICRHNSNNQFLNEQQLELITTRYNQQLERIELENETLDSLDNQQIQQLLYICVRAVRIYQNKELVSLELEPNLNKVLLFTDNLVHQEAREEIHQLKTIILNEFNTLEKKGRIALLLWLGLNLNQADFGSFLNLKHQYQVARLFKRYQRNLLQRVTKVYWQSYFTESISEKRINEIVQENLILIKNYLYSYAQNFFEDILIGIIEREVSDREKKLLQENSATAINHKVYVLFAKSMENELQINLRLFENIELHLAKFVDEWLQDNKGILCNLMMR